jgi:putative mycofactocin binding protein MftB
MTSSARSPVSVDRPYELHPQVGLRDERFGALAYHFGNRRLTFLNDRSLVDVVRTAGEHADLGGALAAAGVADDRRPAFLRALERLADAEVIRERG